MNDNTHRKNSLSGEKLKQEVNTTKPERAAIIENFFYEKSVMMVSADPGAGKSVLVANVIASLSVGLFCFGKMFIPKPRICYYIPFERGKEEIMERFQHIQKSVPINWDNIHINENFIGMNVIDSKHADEIIGIIRQDCPNNPDIIFLDPIYATVAGGLSTDDKASQFCRFSARLQAEFKCSIWLNHHTVKETYSNTGDKITKSDPFYGSQWLKAHCTASYHMMSSNDGVLLEKKKDSQGNLVDKLNLGFNEDDYTQYAIDYDDSTTAEMKLKAFLREQFRLKTRFTFAQIRGVNKGVSTQWTRHLLTLHPIFSCLKKHKSNGKATLYEVISDEF